MVLEYDLALTFVEEEHGGMGEGFECQAFQDENLHEPHCNLPKLHELALDCSNEWLQFLEKRLTELQFCRCRFTHCRVWLLSDADEAVVLK